MNGGLGSNAFLGTSGASGTSFGDVINNAILGAAVVKVAESNAASAERQAANDTQRAIADSQGRQETVKFISLAAIAGIVLALVIKKFG